MVLGGLTFVIGSMSIFLFGIGFGMAEGDDQGVLSWILGGLLIALNPLALVLNQFDQFLFKMGGQTIPSILYPISFFASAFLWAIVIIWLWFKKFGSPK